MPNDILGDKLREARELVADTATPHWKRLGRMRYLLGYCDGTGEQARDEKTRQAAYYVGMSIAALRRELEGDR